MGMSKTDAEAQNNNCALAFPLLDQEGETRKVTAFTPSICVCGQKMNHKRRLAT